MMSHFNKLSHEHITFFDQDLELNKEARITSIILEVGMAMQRIGKCHFRRVLEDTGATKNILYFKCFKDTRMNDSYLKPSNMVIEGFTAQKIRVREMVKVKVTLGSQN